MWSIFTNANGFAEAFNASLETDRRSKTPGRVGAPRIKGGIEFRDLTFAYTASGLQTHVYQTRKNGRLVGAARAAQIDAMTSPALLAPCWQGFDRRKAVRDYPLINSTLIGLSRRDLSLETHSAKTLVRAVRKNSPQRTDTETFRGFPTGRSNFSRKAASVAISPRNKAFRTNTPLVASAYTFPGHNANCDCPCGYADPRILILDDSLSAVDTYTEEQILHNLRDVRSGRTTLIVSHRVSTIRDADLICVLDAGRIIERGTHDELLKLNGEYATLYQRQLLEEELEATD